MSNKIKLKVKGIVLQPNATYLDWQTASNNAQRFYVINATQQTNKKLGKNAGVDDVQRGIKAFYSKPNNQSTSLSMAFGMVYTAVTSNIDPAKL